MATASSMQPTIEPKPVAATLRIKPGFEWSAVLRAAMAATPEAFTNDGLLLNLIDGSWGTPGNGRAAVSPIDGTVMSKLPFIDLATGQRAVKAAHAEQRPWGALPLSQRRDKLTATLADMQTHRDLLASLLMWEIGKPLAAAQADVDRCIEGVRWYVDNIEPMLHGRKPLGLISNIASWNYPLSVLVHVVLIQALAGNSVIAKAPTDGGGLSVGVSLALARRHGLPVSFVSGSGGTLSDALVRNEYVDCLSFVGGRSNGRDVASSLVDTHKRYMIEMEGVNAYAVWEFSQWDLLAKQIRKGFEYAKQRCTAYPRFVVQRRLLPAFLDMYLGVVKSLRFGNPLLVSADNDPLPALDFGPLINAKKVEELKSLWSEALAGGALPIYQGSLAGAQFLPGQDTSSYFAPAALLNMPRSCKLYYNEPFGPLDAIITVDRFEELVTEMNVSNGNLVSSIATDDTTIAARAKQEVRSFKFGHNVIRSRGDKEEHFGGLGQSWKGCFVGGELLVRAITQGTGDDELPGVFPEGTRLPKGR
jgi:acyl-CoA reductase-like NAD-dependent aldehyde dehydrogenase